MNFWVILCLSLYGVSQGVPAGNGYYYTQSAKEIEQPQPTGVQNDFNVNQFISDHKQTIFSSISGKPKANTCADCSCGVPNANRIVGGTHVRSNKYPWIAQLLRGSRLFCGGTLINDRYIVTAAHCIEKDAVKKMSIRLLQYDRNSFQTPGIRRKVEKAIVHENYNPTTIANDIALLLLDSPIPFNDTIRPVCLPLDNEHFDHKMAIVSGWGLTQEYGSTSTILREVTVPIITNPQCKATTYKAMITENMICAGDVENGGKDACQGDSGGPLIVSTGKFKLAGIVSFGYGCAKPNAPGVYTRVSKYLDWIYKNTANGCYCNKS